MFNRVGLETFQLRRILFALPSEWTASLTSNLINFFSILRSTCIIYVTSTKDRIFVYVVIIYYFIYNHNLSAKIKNVKYIKYVTSTKFIINFVQHMIHI